MSESREADLSDTEKAMIEDKKFAEDSEKV